MGNCTLETEPGSYIRRIEVRMKVNIPSQSDGQQAKGGSYEAIDQMNRLYEDIGYGGQALILILYRSLKAISIEYVEGENEIKEKAWIPP